MGSEDLDVIRVPEWQRFPWLQHGFSTRSGGVSTVYGGHDLNLGFTRDDVPAAVHANRERFLEALAGPDHPPLIAVRQVHGIEVLKVHAGQSDLTDAEGRGLREADGLITDQPGIMLAVQAADCVPVLIADPVRRAVGAFHAGWRGTVAGIVGQGIARMATDFGSDPADLVAAVGPCISACCYTVGEEVRSQFQAAFPDAEEFLEKRLFDQRPDGLHLDLAESNRRQLVAAGLAPANIVVLGQCTACSRVGGRRRFFSHRAEEGFTGRAMGAIGISA